MGIVYDEQWITTKREIGVCDGAIRNYEKIIRRMEEKYGMKTSGMIEKFKRDETADNPDFRKWYDTYLALERCKKRKEELEAFLE
ncbi:MAG: hypothetical protein OHK0032_10630 [Thermodesulfovibrionales bacterium]